MKELFELNIGSMIIDEYERRFLEFLKYVSFIKDEQVKNQIYLSGIPSFISDKIQYDDPKTLDETIRLAKFLYDKKKSRPTFQKAWEDKRNSSWIRGRRELSHHSSQITLKDNQLLENPERLRQGVKGQGGQPIQCWGCKEYYMFRDCPRRGEKVRIVHNVQQF